MLRMADMEKTELASRAARGCDLIEKHFPNLTDTSEYKTARSITADTLEQYTKKEIIDLLISLNNAVIYGDLKNAGRPAANRKRSGL